MTELAHLFGSLEHGKSVRNRKLEKERKKTLEQYKKHDSFAEPLLADESESSKAPGCFEALVRGVKNQKRKRVYKKQD